MVGFLDSIMCLAQMPLGPCSHFHLNFLLLSIFVVPLFQSVCHVISLGAPYKPTNFDIRTLDSCHWFATQHMSFYGLCIYLHACNMLCVMQYQLVIMSQFPFHKIYKLLRCIVFRQHQQLIVAYLIMQHFHALHTVSVFMLIVWFLSFLSCAHSLTS